MKTQITILMLICLFPLHALAQPYEITEVDIFNLKKFLNPDDIIVYGISINNSIVDVYEKFGKTKTDFISKDSYHFLDIKPGFKIRSLDQKTVDAILISKEFKGNLKGKTAALFDITKSEDFKNHLTECLGEPDKYDPNKVMGMEIDIIYYMQGFRFLRSFDREEHVITMELTSMENMLKR